MNDSLCSTPLRKGWCPGALRPMPAKDGLLVRLRLTGGILTASSAFALADLSERYGNGKLDLSARGNLQMRGMAQFTLPALHKALDSYSLLDRDSKAEAVRNVVASPLAGLHSGPDIRPIVQALEDGLTSVPDLRALPGKFGFLVDDGSDPSLASMSMDVRFDMHPDGQVAVGLGGTRADALHAGRCQLPDIPERAIEIARGFLALSSRHADLRRMQHARALLGDAIVGQLCCETQEPRPTWGASRAVDVVGPRCFAGLPVLGLAAPFGRIRSSMLRDAAGALPAASLSVTAAERLSLRLTPWRVILVPGSTAKNVDGFVTNPSNPLLRVAACVGRDGCERATTDTRADAAAFAPLLPNKALHVSGCEKGCAKATPTAVTLIARAGRYDLVLNGTSHDVPTARGLDPMSVGRMLQMGYP